PEPPRAEHPAGRVELHDDATLSIGHVDVAGAIDREAFGLFEQRRLARRRRAAREELCSAVEQPIENAETAIAVERREQQLLASRGAELGVEPRRRIEVAREIAPDPRTPGREA